MCVFSKWFKWHTIDFIVSYRLGFFEHDSLDTILGQDRTKKSPVTSNDIETLLLSNENTPDENQNVVTGIQYLSTS